MKKRKSVLHTAALTAFTLALGGTAWAEGGDQGSGTSASQSESGAAEVERQERQGQQSQPGTESQDQQSQQEGQFAEQGQSVEEQGQQSTYQSSAGSQEQSEIKEAQRVLKDHDLYQGNIDGIVGPQTRSALRQYQEQQGLEVSGSLDQQTKQALGVSEGAERQPVSGMEGSDIQRTAGTSQEYQLSQLESGQVQQLQQKLQSHGLYQGEVDGVIGPQTKSAMREFFQRQAQLVGQDKLSAEALQFFGIEASDIQRTSGEQPSGESQQPTWGQQQEPTWEQQQQQQAQPPGEGQQGTQGQSPSGQQGTQGQSPSGQQGMEDQPQGTTPEPGEPERPMQPEDRPPEYME